MRTPSTTSAVPVQATFLRDYFEITNIPKNNSHWVTYCNACIQNQVDAILEADRQAESRGELAAVRTLEEARVAAKASAPGMPISSRTETLEAHVKACTLIGSKNFRTTVLEKRKREKAENIYKRTRNSLSNVSNSYSSLPAMFSGPIPTFSPPSFGGMFASTPSPPPLPPAGPAPFPFAPSVHQPLPVYPGAPQYTPSQSTAHRIPPTPDPLRPTTPLQRSDGSFWTPSDVQHEFIADLTRWFAACNFAWNAVEHPETKTFFTKWVPNVDLPSRDSMAGPLLRAQVKRSIANVRRKVSGKLAMAQWDGWKNKARRPVVTGMMTVEGEAYLVRSHDTFGKPKTAEALWGVAQGDMEYMQTELGVDVIGACTDDGPDGKGMRRTARTLLPWLILLLCWAHQNQLIIGDLIKQNPALKRLLTRALDLIKWFLNHGTALSLLHKEQLLDPEVREAITLLLPVVTRWGAHYVSISRLLRLKDAVRTVCVRKADDLLAIRTRADANESESSRTMTAQEVITLVADHTFWTDLKRAKEHIEPLAISSHVLQADGVRMDQVLLTLANLFRIYAASHVDEDIRRCVHASLEKRWKAADQELFILAVLFNPYVRITCFRDTVLPPNVIAEICIRQYTRIMRVEPNLQFWAACNRYMNSTGLYAPARMALERHRITAEHEGTQVNLVQIWEAIRCEDVRTPAEIADRQLVTFAIRILSAVANSGACERCFSRFGITHTALRNRLAVKSTHDINIVRMDVDATHAAAGNLPSRLKRQLGRTTSTNAAPPVAGSSSIPGRAGALEDAVAQLLADDNVDGDAADLDRLADRLAGGDSAREDDFDEFPPTLAAHFTKIKLCDLFRYPEEGDATTSPLAFYWNGGIRELEAEEEVMDAAAGPVTST